MSKKKILLVENEKQLRELVTPARNEIRMALEMLGEASIVELSEHMRRSPESLYYHIRKLESVGLVNQTGTQNVSGREEALYALSFPRIRVNTGIRRPSFVKSLVRGTKTLLRYAERSLSRAFENPETVIEGDYRECRIVQLTSRSDRKNIIELNRRILELEKFMESIDDPNSHKKFVLTICLSPANSAHDK